MDNVLYESIYELNSIIAEVNSEFIYESIMLESDSSKSILEKIKDSWKFFMNDMKKIIKACSDFLIKNSKRIMESADIKVIVNDRTVLLNALRELNDDNKQGYKAFDKIVNGYDYYLVRFEKRKMITMYKSQAIKYLEKQLNEANSLIEEFDKDVDLMLKVYERDKDKLGEHARYKAEMVSSSRKLYRKLINEIVDEIERVTIKKRDVK